MSIDRAKFGQTPDGRAVELFTLRGGEGSVVKIMTFGGRITEIHTRNCAGKLGNITLGHDRLEPYLQPNDPFSAASSAA